MSDKVPQKEGPPWKKVARYNTFEEADQKRNELLEEENLHVKVHWLQKNNHFAVKTRFDPEAIALLEKREEKKRRKKKLQKKRRKK